MLYKHDYPWPMMLVLALGVFVPTACVIWFMSEAMSNERFAVNQKVTELYRHQFELVRERYREHWNNKFQALEDIGFDQTGAEIFEYIVRKDLASSAVLVDDRGNIEYPSRSTESEISMPASWAQALKIEHADNDHSSALKVYKAIATKTPDNAIKARAYMAVARSNIKLQQYLPALDVLTRILADSRFNDIGDSLGRLIQPNAQLRALQLIDQKTNFKQSSAPGESPFSPHWNRALDTLLLRLNNYSDQTLKGNQRLFLMDQLETLQVEENSFPTHGAERLAARYIESGSASLTLGGLYETRLPDVVQYVTAQNGTTVLYTREDILSEFNQLKSALLIPEGVNMTLYHPNNTFQSDNSIVVIPVGSPLQGWQLGFEFTRESPFGEAAKKQISVYLWTGTLIVLTIIVLALITARFVGRQLQSSRLKKDLVDTVSHELKTPLSSMRMLVDTLLNGEHELDTVTKEYLQLVAKENTRLSQLIDNFLTFSRMEKNKSAFNFQKQDPGAIAAIALDMVREKFQTLGFLLESTIEDGLPEIVADENLLVRALVNLLENALKYSAESRTVLLNVDYKNDHVRFQVQDYGIGIPQNEIGKIFDRFYRVDKRLSQDVDGCGLGLNIVEFVIKAHCGSVDVTSDVGEGSVFSLNLPKASSSVSQSLLVNGHG